MAADFDLDGHGAVITGGTSGIGLGMARGLLAAGASVVLWGRDEARNAAAVASLADTGGRVEALWCDVCDEDAVRAAFARAVELLGRVDSCFANAGTGAALQPFVDMTTAEWRRVLATNLDGTFFTLREAARHMIEHGGGSLVVTSSLAAREAQPRGENYAASKAGGEALVRGLAAELARHRVRANAIVPGWVSTPLADPLLAAPAVERKVLPRVPMRRWGSGEDFGGAAVFLASQASSYVTGQALVVDGGYSVF